MVGLDYPLSDFYPEFHEGGKSKITIKHLLTHSSGLPAYIEYFKLGFQSRGQIINDIQRSNLLIYLDLNHPHTVFLHLT